MMGVQPDCEPDRQKLRMLCYDSRIGKYIKNDNILVYFIKKMI